MLLEYVWLTPLIPLLCFIIIGFLGTKMRQGGGYLAILGALISFAIALGATYEYITGDLYAASQPFIQSMHWLTIGTHEINFGVYIDSLSCIMMLFASFISLMIFIYSVGYMGEEEGRRRRYYAEVSLFLVGMMGLVISNNYLMMFVFWEVMGLCSYLLIGFWSFNHAKGDVASEEAASAAKKAFLVTRLGDVCLMTGLFLLLHAFGSLDYTVVFAQGNIASVDATVLTAATLLIFAGAVGKSAQFPLHDWLPDAMAGPTTVSALIHAATMVKGGVYLVARSYPIFIQNADVMLVVAIIGGFTAVFAASMALNNMNIKRVLAYSTLSQLGYMFLGLGAGGYLMAIGVQNGNTELIALGALGYVAGIFHMLNHAFFKGLLFLGSGSVIHSTGTEDMREMGGLGKKMKITSFTMLIGSLSIAGFPLLSGFWSKDLILEVAFAPAQHGLGAEWTFTVLFILGIVTAFMTAFYMFRMWFMTFGGREGKATSSSHGESPKSMTAPLIVLSVFALFSGLGIIVGLGDIIVESLNVSLGTIHIHSGMTVVEDMFTNVWTYVTIALALVGIAIAWFMYGRKGKESEKPSRLAESGPYKLLTKRYFFPQLYNAISWKLGYGIAKGVDYVDKEVVDGAVNGLSNAVVGAGDSLSNVQNGNLNSYAAWVYAGVIILVAIIVSIFVVNGGIQI